MKSQFIGHFRLSERELKKLWGNAIFVFDANIILNFYRYSEDTKEEFYKILNAIKDRIWIPHQSALEYFNNRLKVIGQQEKEYDEAISSLKTIENKFKNSRKHPFIDKKLLSSFSNLSNQICSQLEENKTIHNNRVLEDDILMDVEQIFNGKVGNELKKEELESLINEGEKRFADKIPPGYKDLGKDEESKNDIRKYGDLIIWKQIMEKSKKDKKQIILVIDDKKEDWWLRFKGKTIAPRPELIKEFRELTTQSFYMYQSDRFLEFARDYFDEKVSEDAIREIKELRKSDEELRWKNVDKDEKKSKKSVDRFFNSRLTLEREIIDLMVKRSEIRKKHLGKDKYNVDESYSIEDKEIALKIKNILEKIEQLKLSEDFFNKLSSKE